MKSGRSSSSSGTSLVVTVKVLVTVVLVKKIGGVILRLGALPELWEFEHTMENKHRY